MDRMKQDLIDYIGLVIELKGGFADQAQAVLSSYGGFTIQVASRYELTGDDLLERKKKQYPLDIRRLFHEWFETEERLKREYDSMMERHLRANADWKGKTHLVQAKYLALTKDILAEKADLRRELEGVTAKINDLARALKQKGRDLEVPDLDKTEGFLNLLENVTADMLMINLVQGTKVLI